MYTLTDKFENILKYVNRWSIENHRDYIIEFLIDAIEPLDLIITVWQRQPNGDAGKFIFGNKARCSTIKDKSEEYIILYIIDTVEESLRNYENNLWG